MTKEEILAKHTAGKYIFRSTDLGIANDMHNMVYDAMQEYATQEKQCWVKLTDQHIEGNPLMLFDDGSICYFNEDWPFAVATHYMPDAPQKPEV